MDSKLSNILVIDDDLDIQEVIAEELEFHGFRNIYFANNGQHALEILRKHPIEIILSDLQMPKMNGLELYHQLKKMDTMPHFILVTGSDVHDLSLCPEDSLELIQKPFEFEYLIQKMNALNSLRKPTHSMEAQLQTLS